MLTWEVPLREVLHSEAQETNPIYRLLVTKKEDGRYAEDLSGRGSVGRGCAVRKIWMQIWMPHLKSCDLSKSHFSVHCVLSHFSHVRLFLTLWTLAIRLLWPWDWFSRQEYWSGLPCPPPGDLPDPGIKPVSLMSPELAGGFFTIRATGEEGKPLFSGDTSFFSSIR